ncbi:MAG: HepT-like ribonuclease domain-containing protein [Rhizobiaceae bacterium]
MVDRTIFRLRDIVDAIDQIEELLADRTFSEVFSNRVLRAAFERFLEILSEASRHIPSELKEEAPEIPWQDIAAIGNHLRHAYHRVDFEILWRIYEDGQLNELRAAVEGFLETKL